ncbi:MAG: FAD-dependent oxidoreductase, partial [Gemmatimonadaceae bacterium]
MSVRVVETDVCIVGSGISAAMVAWKLAQTRRVDVLVLEAGDEAPPTADWHTLRARYLAYGESPWPRDHIDGTEVEGIQSRSMQVGGLAMHWGGVTPRFSPEDFRVRSMYEVGADWALTYEELDPFYQEAEEYMGVAGEQGPDALDPRGKPFPLPALPLTYNLTRLKDWVASAGIPMWSQPSAKLSLAREGRGACCRNDTCFPICPVGAKYSPDMTWRALRASGRVRLMARTIVRRLTPKQGSREIDLAEGFQRDRPDEPLHVRAKTFVVACGYAWSPYLLLMSADSRHPNGLANSSGLVGKYLCGHRSVQAYIELPMHLYPGMNEQHSLVTKAFMRPTPSTTTRYLRHDLRVWESSAGREPRLRSENGGGELLLGDALLADWRTRIEKGTARVRSYYDVLPARESELTLDSARKTPWGAPMPGIAMRDSADSQALRPYQEEEISRLFERLARAGNGRIMRKSVDEFQDHPAGGCRMGTDAGSSVVDSYGRTHDHENLFVVGAPTMPTAGCANGTLTFCALSLRSATKIGER